MISVRHEWCVASAAGLLREIHANACQCSVDFWRHPPCVVVEVIVCCVHSLKRHTTAGVGEAEDGTKIKPSADAVGKVWIARPPMCFVGLSFFCVYIVWGWPFVLE